MRKTRIRNRMLIKPSIVTLHSPIYSTNTVLKYVTIPIYTYYKKQKGTKMIRPSSYI